MEQKNMDTKSDNKDVQIIYKRHKTIGVIERLERGLQERIKLCNISDNGRLRIKYVIAVLREGALMQKTIMLREPFDIENVERHLGIPEVSDDFEWVKIRKDFTDAEKFAPVTYVLHGEPVEPPDKGTTSCPQRTHALK